MGDWRAHRLEGQGTLCLGKEQGERGLAEAKRPLGPTVTRVQGDWWWKDADQQYRLSGTVVVGPVTRWSARSPVGRPGHPLVDLVTHWSAQSPAGRPGHPLVGPVTCWSAWSPVGLRGHSRFSASWPLSIEDQGVRQR